MSWNGYLFIQLHALFNIHGKSHTKIWVNFDKINKILEIVAWVSHKDCISFFCFRLRRVYLVNIAIDTCSMFFMYFFNSKIASVAFSFASGILYCTIFTIPYIIVARYHTLNVVSFCFANFSSHKQGR